MFTKQIISFFIFLLGISFTAFSQVTELDGAKKKIPLRKIAVHKKVIPPQPPVLKEKSKTPVSTSLKKYQKKQNPQNFLLETLPEDRDIIGKRYLNGKDVTHQKLKTAMSLGTVNTTSKMVTIECRDHSYVDGDRVRLYINNKPTETSIGLKGHFFTVDIVLNEGYNRIDFKALNQGLSGPNTAEFRLYDQQGNLLSSKQWGLLTGETATLGVVKIRKK